MTDKPDPKNRKFKTLFDGDEIEGKRYGLGAGVTGLDASTATFLERSGRIEEVSDKAFKALPGPDTEAGQETDEERAAREALADAQARYDAGAIPEDLIDPDAAEDAADKLKSKNDLIELAKADEADFNKSDTKPAIAVAIMAARGAPADGGQGSDGNG